MNVIDVTGVSKAFRSRQVFKGVSLTVRRGTVHGLIGPNGAGKTVLLRLLCRMLRPDSGAVHIAPEFLSADGGFAEQFGVIVDRPGFIPTKTGLQNLDFLASFRRVIDTEQIRRSMEHVGLDPDAPQRVGRYSLGMRQRLALAQATMEDQQVLLLDEPFNALDVSGVKLVHRLIEQARADGKTVVFTSHDDRQIDALADVRLVLDGQGVTTID